MSLQNLSNDEIHDMAYPLFQNIIASSTSNDYPTFRKEFSAELQSCVTQGRFEAQRKEYPLLSSLSDNVEFMDCIRREKGVTALYRLRSTLLNGEFLGAITLEEIDHKIKVTVIAAD